MRLCLGRRNSAMSRAPLCNCGLPRPDDRQRQEGEGGNRAASGVGNGDSASFPLRHPLRAQPMSEESAAAPAVTSRHVARGLGTTVLARLGAMVEIVATPLYALMFGLFGYRSEERRVGKGLLSTCIYL